MLVVCAAAVDPRAREEWEWGLGCHWSPSACSKPSVKLLHRLLLRQQSVNWKAHSEHPVNIKKIIIMAWDNVNDDWRNCLHVCEWNHRRIKCDDVKTVFQDSSDILMILFYVQRSIRTCILFFVTMGNSVMYHISYFNVVPAVSHTFVFLKKLLHISWLVESLCDFGHYWSNTLAAFSIKFSLNEGKWRCEYKRARRCSTKQR